MYNKVYANGGVKGLQESGKDGREE